MLKQYGLLVGVIAYAAIYIRNLIKLNKDEKDGDYWQWRLSVVYLIYQLEYK